MTHWYGWVALACALLEATATGVRMVSRAWRGPVTGLEPRRDWGAFDFAFWVYLAVWMVAS